MFPLGHVGIGTHLVPPRLRARLPWGALALGCLLPDLIDKPLWIAALHFADETHPPFVAGTRIFGHTLLFALLLCAAAALRRAPALWAVAAGDLTHLALDLFGEVAAPPRVRWRGWLFWPLYGWQFPASPIESPLRHLLFDSQQTLYLVGEAVGLALLLWRAFRRRRPRAASS